MASRNATWAALTLVTVFFCGGVYVGAYFVCSDFEEVEITPGVVPVAVRVFKSQAAATGPMVSV